MFNKINPNLTNTDLISDGVPKHESMYDSEAKKRSLEKTQETFEIRISSPSKPPSNNSKSLKKRVKGQQKLSPTQNIIPPKPRTTKVREIRTLEDGTILNGLFVNDIFKSGTRTDKDGTIDKGDFKDNKLEGTGIRQFSNGTAQIGNFKSGKIVGAIF